MSTGELQRAPIGKGILRLGYRAACGGLTVANVMARKRPGIAVHYGGARIGDVGGPLVKVKRLAEHFPDTSWGYNIIYLLSNAPYLPAFALQLLKRRGVPIIYNQNGVFYPGWYAGNWRGQNARMRDAYLAADHVFFQSAFCKRTAERFLGHRPGRGEILFNAVDTAHFRPLLRHSRRGTRFLITGKIGDHLAYRLTSTIDGLAQARKQGLEARLIVSGWVEDGARRAATAHAEARSVAGFVTFTGGYTQSDAPAIYNAGDIYVMTKHNDPCPNTVLEAMACGLPILYSATGGSPELVGDAAGVGLACPEDFDAVHTPSAEAIGDGMLRIAKSRHALSQAARERALAHFDIKAWIQRHRDVFTELLERS